MITALYIFLRKKMEKLLSLAFKVQEIQINLVFLKMKLIKKLHHLNSKKKELISKIKITPNKFFVNKINNALVINLIIFHKIMISLKKDYNNLLCK